MGDDRLQEAKTIGSLAYAAWAGPMTVADGIERCNGLLVDAGEDRLLIAGCTRWLGSLVARQGRFEEARSLIDEAVATYEELGMLLSARATAAFGYGDVERLAGDFGAAERALARASRISSSWVSSGAAPASPRSWRAC